MPKKVSIALLLLLLVQILFAQSIDIGIFKSTIISDQIDIKIKADFDIADDETITAILYTVRWNDPDLIINTEFVFPFFLSPQGDPEEYNGYYYQVFAAVPVNAIALMANQEFIASSFTFTNGDCASFEVIEDEWTQANNGNVYFEFLGEDVTGIIYEPAINYGSIGGTIEGGGTIYLGEPTSTLMLSDYAGNINVWQKRLNEGLWSDIAFTAGLLSYSETPLSPGNWEYRCVVQQGSCPVDYSGLAQVIVLDTITGTSAKINVKENEVAIYCIDNDIFLKNRNSKNLDGVLRVYNLYGQKIFEKNINEIETYYFKLDVHGILVVTYFDKSTKKLYKEKVLIN